MSHFPRLVTGFGLLASFALGPAACERAANTVSGPAPLPTATPTTVAAIPIALRGIPWQWDFYSVPGQSDGGSVATLNRGQTYTVRVFNDAPLNTAPHYFSGIAPLGLSGGVLAPGDSFTQAITPNTVGDFSFLCTDSSCGIGHDRMTGLIHVVP